jgi:uncharacterized protein YceK
MKKLVFALFILTLLVGCGKVDKTVANLTGYSEKCIDGVLYYRFSSGATVAWNPDSTVKTCK